MPWVRLDDQFPDHRKLAELGDYAPLCGWLYVCGLAFCNRQLTDGRIPKAHVHRLASFRHVSIEYGAVKDLAAFCDEVTAENLADMLVGAGLWEDTEDAYIVHDYHDYQPSRAEAEATRQERSRAGSLGAATRWDGKNGKPHGKPLANGIAKPCPVPVPVPVPHVHTQIARSARVRVPRQTTEKATTEPDGFSAFWATYPRRVGRAKALAAYRKLAPDAALQAQMLEAIAVQAKSDQWTRDGGAFVPHPTTWLHGRRWEDEVQPARPVSGRAAPTPRYDDGWCQHDPRCATREVHAIILQREAAHAEGAP